MKDGHLLHRLLLIVNEGELVILESVLDADRVELVGDVSGRVPFANKHVQ